MHTTGAVPQSTINDEGVILGQITPGKGIFAKVKRWDESPTVEWVRKREPRVDVPFVHLFIMPETLSMTMDDLSAKGFTIGDLIGFAERNLGEIISEFLPNVPVSKCKHSYTVTNLSEVVMVPHVSLLIGEQGLFLKYIQRESDPIRHQRRIAGRKN